VIQRVTSHEVNGDDNRFIHFVAHDTANLLGSLLASFLLRRGGCALRFCHKSKPRLS
jgi:hypothetical protein